MRRTELDEMRRLGVWINAHWRSCSTSDQWLVTKCNPGWLKAILWTRKGVYITYEPAATCCLKAGAGCLHCFKCGGDDYDECHQLTQLTLFQFPYTFCLLPRADISFPQQEVLLQPHSHPAICHPHFVRVLGGTCERNCVVGPPTRYQVIFLGPATSQWWHTLDSRKAQDLVGTVSHGPFFIDSSPQRFPA